MSKIQINIVRGTKYGYSWYTTSLQTSWSSAVVVCRYRVTDAQLIVDTVAKSFENDLYCQIGYCSRLKFVLNVKLVATFIRIVWSVTVSVFIGTPWITLLRRSLQAVSQTNQNNINTIYCITYAIASKIVCIVWNIVLGKEVYHSVRNSYKYTHKFIIFNKNALRILKLPYVMIVEYYFIYSYIYYIFLFKCRKKLWRPWYINNF